MSCLAVIDTNILVSALLSKHADSATVKVIEKLFDGEIIPVYSNEITNEYREVLHRKKFKFDCNTVDYLVSAIEKFGILTTPTSLNITLPDMKDLPFYEVVMEKRADDAFLVTGNLKHFPQKPFVVSARQMLEILEKKSNRPIAIHRAKLIFVLCGFVFFKNAVQTQLIKIFSQFSNIFSNSIDFFFKMLYNFYD